MKKKQLQQRSFIGVILVLLTFLFFGYLELDEPVHYDGLMHTTSVKDGHFWNYYNYNTGPGVMYSVYWIKYFFPIENWSVKFPVLLFGFLTLIVVYQIGKQFYDMKTAFWSVFLLAGSGTMLLASTSLHNDGALLMFYQSLAVLFFLRYYRYLSSSVFTRRRKRKTSFFLSLRPYIAFDLVILGFAIGFAILVKYSAIFTVFVIGLFVLLKHRNLKWAFKTASVVLLFALIFASVYPASTFLADRVAFTDVVLNTSLRHPLKVLTSSLFCSVDENACAEVSPVSYGVYHYLLGYLKGVLLVGPLFFFLMCAGVFFFLFREEKMFERPSSQFILLLGISYFAFIWFIVSPLLDIYRYTWFLAAPLSVLGGALLSRGSYALRNSFRVLLFSVLSCFFALLFFLLNNGAHVFYDFRSGDVANILSQLRHFDFSFYVSFVNGTFSEPAIFISMHIVLLLVFIATLALLFYSLKKFFFFFSLLTTRSSVQRSYVRYSFFSSLFFIFLFTAGVGYNLFSLHDYVFHTTTPDMNEVVRDVSVYVFNADLRDPIYVSSAPVGFQLSLLADEYFYLYPVYYHHFEGAKLMYTDGFGKTPFTFSTYSDDTEQLTDFINRLKQSSGGTVVLVDYAMTADKHVMLPYLWEECALLKTVSVRSQASAYVFDCH